MIVKLFVVVLASVIFSTMKADETSQQYCSSLDPIHVAITGYRNQSGHWISQVVVEGDQHRKEGLEPWAAWDGQVDVQYRPVTCTSGETTADIVLTFTVPPSAPGNNQHFARQLTPKYKSGIPPEGYQPLHGVGYYKLHSQGKVFSVARQECFKEGGDLAEIDTPEKLAFVKGLGGGWAWICLQERGTNGVYFTAKGNEWKQPTFLAWHPGQPNFPRGNDCILLLLGDGRIGDTPCELPRTFVCELPWL